MTTTTDLADTHRLAIAVARAHAHGDEVALRALLDALPLEQVPSLLAGLTELVLVAHAATPGDLDAFLDRRLGDVTTAEVIAGQLLESPPAEPDAEA